MKRAAIFYWLIGIAVAAMAIGAAFYLDDTVWHFILRHQNRAVRGFMHNVSRFGDWPSHVALGLLLLGIAWWRGSKKWTRIFLSMLLAMAIAGIAGHVIKRTVPRARPSVKSELRWGGPRFSTKYHSFPSGHVGASAAFFGVLFLARRRIGLVCFAIPILIGFSRMYIGAHYLSDVVCAAVLGFLCALLVASLLLRNDQTSNSKHRTSNGRTC
ncbi:MAG TPA: phosphatase PAP2 family protein [Candidatus Udaeobacter sp.]|jgi:undecaprenyl-diphosphatase